MLPMQKLSRPNGLIRPTDLGYSVALAVHRHKSQRGLIRALDRQGIKLKKQTLSAIVNSPTRVPRDERILEGFERCGGLRIPGLDSDRKKRRLALEAAGHAGPLTAAAAREAISGAFADWTFLAMSPDVHLARRLVLGVAAGAVRLAAAAETKNGETLRELASSADDPGGDRATGVRSRLLAEHRLDTPKGRLESLAETRRLYAGLHELLAAGNFARFVFDDGDLAEAELNGARLLSLIAEIGLISAEHRILAEQSRQLLWSTQAKVGARLIANDFDQRCRSFAEKTSGQANWLLSTATQGAVWSARWDRALKAADALAAVHERFHVEPFGPASPSALDDRELWPLLGAIRKYWTEEYPHLKLAHFWLKKRVPTEHPDVADRLDALDQSGVFPQNPANRCTDPLDTDRYPLCMRIIFSEES